MGVVNRLRGVTVVCCLSLFFCLAGPLLAGYCLMTEPWKLMEKLCTEQELTGEALYKGRVYRCSFSLQRVNPYVEHPDVIEYNLDLKLYEQGAAEPFQVFHGELADRRNASRQPSGDWIIDLRRYPSYSKTAWHLVIDSDGSIAEVEVLRDQFLFDKRATATFGQARRSRFHRLFEPRVD